MKKILYIAIIAFGLTSCDTWLDVNTNPDLARADEATPEQRLPPIIAQFADAYESLGTRACLISQQLSTTYSSSGANWNWTRWRSTPSSTGWPYQAWYINSASNLNPLFEASEKIGAYHYIGAGKVIKAWGFGTLIDAYGILPYKDAFNPAIYMPSFDDAEYIYGEIFKLLDEAIVELQKTQSPGAPALSKGDILNGGNVDEWIKLAYGLKARYLNHLSKKSTYDPAAVLAALDKAPKAKTESSIMQYVDEGPNVPSAAKEAIQYTNNGTASRLTSLYISYLNNTYPGVRAAASGIEDPRIDLLVPSFQSYLKNGVVTTTRSKGVDMASALPKSGPVAFDYYYGTNSSGNAYYGYGKEVNKAGVIVQTPDSIYVALRKAEFTVNGTVNGRDTVIILKKSTGTWYTQRGGQGLFLTHSEMFFIEAEAKFRMGNTSGAQDAYKRGIQAHMELIGVNGADIATYLASAAVAQASDLTMSDIMIQKYIAMSYSPEVFVDVRRHNFCTDASGNYNQSVGVYKGFKRPSTAYAQSYPNPTDWPRRIAISTYTAQYNPSQALAKDPDATKDTYLNKPVWWDMP